MKRQKLSFLVKRLERLKAALLADATGEDLDLPHNPTDDYLRERFEHQRRLKRQIRETKEIIEEKQQNNSN